MAENLTLENAQVKLELAAGHAGVTRLLDKVSGVEHIKPGQKEYRLWELVFRKGTREQTLTNLAVPATRAEVKVLPNGTQQAAIVWENFTQWREKKMLTIRVTVDLPPDDGVAEWRISVENRSTYWGLWEVRFPYFSHALVPGEYDLASALNNWGALEKRLAKKMESAYGYPSCGWAMPFISLTRGRSSVYLGAHDPKVWAKKYLVEPGQGCYLSTYVENMAEPGSSYPGHYPVLAGVYQGDWLDACKRYRAWVLRQAWTQKGPLSKRADVPRSIKETALWFRLNWLYEDINTDPQRMNEGVLDAQKYYGVPIGVHWYLWHHNQFDCDYPFYFPTKPGFAERAKELVRHGVLVMPYINSVIADYDHPEYRERLWPSAAKDQCGVAYMNFYADTSGRMTEMCAFTDGWHDQIVELVDRLTGECGVNAVYLDLLSANAPSLCFDRSHGHPLGGGGWWWEGNRRMLRRVKEIATARGVALTTESIAEPYLEGVEGFLTWAPPIGEEIPMMPAVYSGYALYIGSPVAAHLTETAFVAAEARVLTWGCQPGWMAPEMHRDPAQQSKAAYLKHVAQYRYAARKFLTYGELLNLLPANGPVETVTVVWPDYYKVDQPVQLPVVLGALWRAEDGHLGVILCNLLDRPVTYPYEIDPSQLGLNVAQGRQYRIEQITPLGATDIGRCPAGVVARTEALGPREIKVLEISTPGS